MHTLKDELVLELRYQNYKATQALDILAKLREQLGVEKYNEWVDANIEDSTDWSLIYQMACDELDSLECNCNGVNRDACRVCVPSGDEIPF